MRQKDHSLLWVSAVVSLCLATNVGCRRGSSYYLDEGKQLLADGNAQAAALSYRKALQQDSRSVDALYGLGMAELKLKNAQNAWPRLAEAVKLDPQHVEAKIALADLALAAYASNPHRMEHARETAQAMSSALVQHHPELAAGHRIAGQLALLNQRGSDALTAFRTASARDPKDAAVAIGLVEALLLNEQTDEAIQTAEQWMARHGSHQAMTGALYRHFVSNGDLTSAEKVLAARVKAAPAELQNRVELARLYTQMGRRSESEQIIDEMLREASFHPGAAIVVGDYYRTAGNAPAALKAYTAGTQGSGEAASLCAVRLASLLRSDKQGEKALLTLEQALAKDPKSTALAAARIDALLERGRQPDYAQALKLTTSLTAENRGNPALAFLHGRALLATGDQKQALQQFTTAARMAPGRPESQLTLAHLALGSGNLVDALKHASAAVEADPQNVFAVSTKAEALKRSGSFGEARQELTRLLASRPGLREAEIQIAEIDLISGKTRSAERAFAELYSESEDLRALRGLVASKMARDDAAAGLKLLESKAAALQPDGETGALIVGSAAASNKLQSGLDLLNRMAIAHPRSAAVHASLAELHRARGDYAAALQSIELVRQIDPAYPALDAVLGSVREQMADAAGALKAYRSALQKDPANPMVRNNLANLLVETGGSADEAMKVLAPARTTLQDHPVINDTLAWIYVKRGTPNLAVEILQPLVAKEPRNAGYRYHLGMAYLVQGDKQAARRELTAGLNAQGDERTRTRIQDELRKLGPSSI